MVLGKRSEVGEMSCFPKTGLLGSGLGKHEGRLRQGVTEIEGSGLGTVCAGTWWPWCLGTWLGLSVNSHL